MELEVPRITGVPPIVFGVSPKTILAQRAQPTQAVAGETPVIREAFTPDT